MTQLPAKHYLLQEFFAFWTAQLRGRKIFQVLYSSSAAQYDMLCSPSTSTWYIRRPTRKVELLALGLAAWQPEASLINFQPALELLLTSDEARTVSHWPGKLPLGTELQDSMERGESLTGKS